MPRKSVLSHAAGLIALVCLLTTSGRPQKISNYERERAKDMLADIAVNVRKHYYDPKFHGIDWDARVQEAKQKIDKVETQNLAFSQIAAALDSLNDSHTYFVPPQRPYRHDYGWRAQMIGDHCYVIRVRPGTDAEAKAIKPGDEVLAINGFVPRRDTLWRINYLFKVLRPQLGLRLNLRQPSGSETQLDAMAKMALTRHLSDLRGPEIWDFLREAENEGHRMRIRSVELGDELMIVKVPEFFFSETDVDAMLGKARKRKALILDLRGNPGGSVDALKYLIGGMFDHEVKIGDRVGRDFNKPMVAKAHGHPFTGKLVVLVDSDSASAAEIFARVVQIEKRGVVVGDQSAGSVMEGKEYSYHIGYDVVMFFGAMITDADLVLTDGKSLERAGVVPDEVVLPTAIDLAGGRDPVVAHAAETLGAKLSAEAAGKMFPYEWPK